MKSKIYFQRLSLYVCLIITLAAANFACGQQAYFADGYHGGVYGHYPMWQAKFMVDKLNDIPGWKINLEIEPETWDYVKENDAENFKRLQDYYETKGRFGRIEFANPAYAQPYSYNISGESLIRHFTYGMAKINENFPNASFKTYSCEEPCFTSCMPQILKSLGFEYAVLRCPNTCWGGYPAGFGKDLINWQSSDGSSILAVPRYGCEELLKGSTFETSSNRNSTEFIQTCFNYGIQYPVGMCFQDAGWRGGPWLGSIVKQYYNPTEYVTWTDYIEMVAPKVTPDTLNFTIEDVKPGLVWGSHILQKLAQEIRLSENKIVMAEKIASFGSIFNSVTYPQTQFDQAWRNLMLSQHHDCWIVPYNNRPGGNWATNVTEWTAKTNQIADSAIGQVLDNHPEAPSDTQYITVFNILGNRRSDIAEISLSDSSANYQVLDMQNQPVTSQTVKNKDGSYKLLFQADVPAMGCAAYQFIKTASHSAKNKVNKLDNGSIQIETNYYHAIIDPAKGGTITSLHAKKLDNLQLVKDDAGLNYLRGYFYDQNKFISTQDNTASVSIIENGPVMTRLQIESDIAGNPYSQLITFYQNSPRIDFDLAINWQGQPGIGAYSQKNNYDANKWEKAFYNDKYKLQLRFPFSQIGSKVFKNAPFDVCESRLDNTYYDSWGTIKHNVILNWVDVTDKSEKLGVALFSDHTTSYINSENMPLGLTVQYTGKALWGRNYKIHGPTNIKYALFPHTGKWDSCGIHTASTAWNEPLIATVSNRNPQILSASLAEIQTRGVELTSVTVSDGQLYLRLFNAEAPVEDITVNLFTQPESIQLVELNNRLIKNIIPVKINDKVKQVKLRIPRFGVRTLKLF